MKDGKHFAIMNVRDIGGSQNFLSSLENFNPVSSRTIIIDSFQPGVNLYFANVTGFSALVASVDQQEKIQDLTHDLRKIFWFLIKLNKSKILTNFCSTVNIFNRKDIAQIVKEAFRQRRDELRRGHQNIQAVISKMKIKDFDNQGI